MRFTKSLAVAAIGLQLAASGAYAAGDTNTQTSSETAATAPHKGDDDHLFGDWGGLRSTLAEKGITLDFSYTSETTGNVSGGTRRALRYADQRALFVGIDWDKLLGVPNLSTNMVIVNRGGTNTSEAYGDYFEPSQEIYGSGGNVAAHLVMLYGHKTWNDGKIALNFGYYPLGVDFVGSPLYCEFMSGAICSNPKGSRAFSAWPAATLGSSVTFATGKDTSIALGLFGYDPHLFIPPVYHSGWNIDPSRYRGVEVPVQFNWTPHFGTDDLIGHYRIGGGYTNSENQKFLGDIPGVMGASKRGVFQFWALADQMLVRHGPGDRNGLIAMAGFYHTSAETIVYNNSVFAGILDQGILPGRPQDTAGLMVDLQTVSPQLAKLQRAQQSLGLPIYNNATAPQSHEVVIEANYSYHAGHGITIMPDIQYVVHPNAQKTYKNALVFGLKLNIDF